MKKLAGHVVDLRSNTPPFATLVEAWNTVAGASQPLGSATSDRSGNFTLEIAALPEGAPGEVALYVFDAARTRRLVRKPARVRLGREGARDIVIRLDAPAPPAPIPEDLEGVQKGLALGIPDALGRYLQGKQIRTLTDLRLEGDFATDRELPVAADDPALVTLQSLAALAILPTDIATNAALAAAGLHDVLDVAAASPSAIQTAIANAPTAAPPAVIRSAALDQANAVSNFLFDLRVQAAFGQRDGLPQALQDALPQVCSCADCQSALSPIAYLADLINYSLQHLRNNGQPITLGFLQNRLHQPLRDLTASCAELDRKVRRLRIGIEILRQHLAPTVPSLDLAILEAAYRSLLQNIGASYEEIRRVSRRGTPPQRAELMARIMMPASVPLIALFKDPNASAGNTAVTEAWLNRTFGLRDTTLAPMAVAADPRATVPAQFPDVLRWQRRFLWDQWSALDAAASDPTLGGGPFIDPDVIGQPDLVDVTSNPIPRAQRLDRTQWSVLDFLEDRQYWITSTITDLRATVTGNAGGVTAGLTALLQALQSPATSFPQVTKTGLEGLTVPALRAIYARQQAGVSIDTELQTLQVTADEVDALGRVVDLAFTGDPILSSEWDDFNGIIIGRLKRFGFYQVWKIEEQQLKVTIDGTALVGLTLSPFHFQARSVSRLASNTAWVAQRWRSTDADRARWDQLLASRTDQLQNVVTVLQGAVDAAEIIELPEICHLLLRAAQPPGVTLVAITRRLTDRYQIDFIEGACAFTTRIAQAIETLQDVLFGVRNGLVDDPALTIDDDGFDDTWQWLGGYATWQAAMQVVLYPETVLRPTLRARQSPGFVDFVANLRTAGRITPDLARTAIAEYERYFVDVCNLGPGVCTPAPAPGTSSNDSYNYLFALSSSGRLYWCYFDASDEQSFWRRLDVQALDASHGELQLFGAAYYAGDAGERYLYLFAKQTQKDADQIVFARTDLGADADWSALDWQSDVLAPLPRGASHFAFAAVLTATKPTDPIRISVWLNGTDAYTRALADTGDTWEQADFQQVAATGSWRRLGGGAARGGRDFACSAQPIQPRFVVAGDFDRDGVDEIVILPNFGGTEGNDIWVMKFDPPTGMWSHLSPIAGHPFGADIDIGAIDTPARFAVAGDFDGDGFPELALAANLSQAGAASNMDDTCFWALKFNTSTRMWDPLGRPPDGPLPYGVSFGSKNDFWSIHIPALTTRYAVAADFDGDGRDEVAIASSPVFFADLKVNANTFLVFSLELGANNDHVWQKMADLQCEAPYTPDLINPRVLFSRFALAAKFRPGDDRATLLVGKKMQDKNKNDVDANLGNDFWNYRYDGSGWIVQSTLDCANLNVAAKFGVAGDFDGDGHPEVAIAQAATLPGAAQIGFWIGKMDVTGAWSQLPQLLYGAGPALFAIPGDFDGDGADELAVVNSDASISVFDLNNGQWSRLAATNAGMLGTGGPLTAGLQGGQIAEDQFVVSAVAARLLPQGATSHRGTQLVALAQPATDNTGIAFAYGTTITGQWSTACGELEVKPALAVSSPVFATPDIAVARALNALARTTLGTRKRRTNRDYLEEMLYFVPLETANRLRDNGFLQAALDWCRIVYDYGAPINQRVIAAKLLDDQSLSAGVYGHWLQDTLNPHAIAETRRNAYFKYTVLLICHCLVDWADAEFTRATAESLPEARELYERALDLLDLPEIRQRSNDCDELLDTLVETIGDKDRTFAYEPVVREIARVRDPAALAALSQTITDIVRGDASLDDQVATSLAAVRAALDRQGDARAPTFGELQEQGATQLKTLARLVLADAARSGVLIALPNIRRPGEQINDKVPGPSHYVPAVLTLCIPPDPALTALRRHAQLCLDKIRACKNIAGLDLCLDPYAAMTAKLTGADQGQLPTMGAAGLQPMPYHYSTLIERTKQLVELARQMESSMLQFISAAEQAQYDQLKAQQDLELTRAGVQLKALQTVQANDGLVAAGLQRDRAEFQVTHFTQLIGNGLTQNETQQVANLVVADLHQHATAIGAWVEAAFGVGSYSNAVAASGAAWGQNSQFHGLMASFERRDQEWRYERGVAQQDVASAQQQMRIAQDQVVVATEEQAIAALQAAHARTVADFLANKFLNADLYEWMTDVLEQVYRFFLQQATQFARLAEWQLAFERQEPPAAVIKADYWDRPTSDLTPDVGASATGTNSVRGLTGSARLLRDVYELDQYAFAKNQRKQQLSETLSLAQLDPFAFQTFRKSGRLPFATPMSLFDGRFPGHYVRLIKRVRVSVVALIPPTMGVRASLSSIGPTRVTIGPDVFRTVTIQREPQRVSYTSAVNATGLFDLDAQPELLVPFEGLGVDGQWLFEMPLAANPFDFDAVADVLVTVDYTSLYDADYEQQVLAGLDRRFGADRAFSFRRELEDAWYDLNNPDLADAPDVPLTVSFVTRRIDFPPHLRQLAIGQVLMQFVQKPETRQAIDVTALFYTNAAGQAIPPGGGQRAASSDADGLISTRRGAWSALIGGAIDGDLTWTLTLPAALKPRFDNEEITDIFFVISYSALLA
jgi:hypothetical protein